MRRSLWRASIGAFGSARMAIILLAVFAVAMIIGTVIESQFNAAMARAIVFQAIWFAVLLGLITLSLLVSLIDRLPYQPRLLGFYLIHLSLILVFCSALLSSMGGVSGTMRLRPGQPERQVMLDGEVVPLMLPFALELVEFEIEYAFQSKKELGYRAKVRSHLDQSVSEIEMNQPLNAGGYRFYQASYFKTLQGELGTILSVNKDPGRAGKYLGSILFLIGLLVHLRVRAPAGAVAATTTVRTEEAR